MTITLTQLRALDALERERHFSRAADAIGISQPAISAQIKKLQESCAASLIYRWDRKVEFSQLGREMALKARKIVGLLDDFESSLEAAADLRSGYLGIGLGCHYFVMDILAVFMERYPGIQLKAQIGDSKPLLEKVLACQLDIAGVTGGGSDPRLYRYKYSDQHIVVLVAADHPWAGVESVPIGELAGEPMVARTSQSMTRYIFSAAMEKAGIDPDVVLELDTWETMKEAVASGIGFAVALEDEAGHDERIVKLKVADMELTAAQYFVCLKEYQGLGTVRAFLELVHEARMHRQASMNRNVLPLRTGKAGAPRSYQPY